MYVSIMPISITSLYFCALFGTICCFLWSERPGNACREDQTVRGTVRFIGESPNTVGCYPNALRRGGSTSQRCLPYIVQDLRNNGVLTTCNHTGAQLTSEIVHCTRTGEGEYDCQIDKTDHWILTIDLQLSTTGTDLCTWTNLQGEQRRWWRGHQFVTLLIGRLSTPTEAPFSVGVSCGENGCDVRGVRLLVVKYKCLQRRVGYTSGV